MVIENSAEHMGRDLTVPVELLDQLQGSEVVVRGVVCVGFHHCHARPPVLQPTQYPKAVSKAIDETTTDFPRRLADTNKDG